VVRLRDALTRVDAEALRYFFLSTHYRSPLAFSDKSLADAESRVVYFYETLRKVDERTAGKDFGTGPLHLDPEKFLADFVSCVDDDFNFAGALGILSGLFATMNELTDKPPVKDKPLIGRTLKALREGVSKLSTVLGLFEDEPSSWLLRRRDRQVSAKGLDRNRIEGLIADRRAARERKDFAAADQIRADLTGLGVEIMDSPQGTTWKVIA
jgi:cysteinyl-tRNA synthetase